MEEKRLEYLTMLQIHGSDTLALTQLLTDLPPLQHRHLHNPPILKPYKENQKRFTGHSLHSSIFGHRQFLILATPVVIRNFRSRYVRVIYELYWTTVIYQKQKKSKKTDREIDMYKRNEKSARR